jgi:hypothetical protein
MEFLQILKFSELDNNYDIIFCKRDYIDNELDKIKNSNINDVILITGDSDYSVDETYINKIPNNIKYWYSQNLLIKHPKLKALPLGLENHLNSVKIGHGTGWFKSIEKYNFIKNYKDNIKPNKKITSCYDVYTNYNHRSYINNVIKECDYITKNNKLTFLEYIEDILNHECVICPTGNGLDTHRIYETLYVNRIPITFKVCDSPLYDEIYSKLPIIILGNPEQLLDNNCINNKIEEIKQNKIENKYNLELLDYNYWKNNIINKL